MEAGGGEPGLMSCLPPELLVQIFCYTNAGDQPSLSLVCKSFHVCASEKRAFGDVLHFKQELVAVRIDLLDLNELEDFESEEKKRIEILAEGSKGMKRIRKAITTMEDRRTQADVAASFTSIHNAVSSTLHSYLSSSHQQTQEEEASRIILSKRKVVDVWVCMGVLRVIGDQKMLSDEDRNMLNARYRSLIDMLDMDGTCLRFSPFILFEEERLSTRWNELGEKNLSDEQLLLAEEYIRRSTGDIFAGTCPAARAVHFAMRKNLQSEKYDIAAQLGDVLTEFLGMDTSKTHNSAIQSVYIDAGRAHWGQRQWEKATRYYSIAITLPSVTAGDFADCGYVHLKSKKYEDAVMYYETAIMLDPSLDPKHWADYGFVLYQLGQYNDAEDKVSQAIAREPDLPPECYVNYGLIQLKQFKYNQAAANFQYAIEREVLNDSRATPFVDDFIEAFEKSDVGAAGYASVMKVCEEKLNSTE